MFSGSDVDKKLNVLSGGEVVRLGLCKILKMKPNFLILDEPTNHMDIVSKETIEQMLKGYKGTIIFVSHDRYFVRKISDSLLVLDNGEATYYPYGYNQYMMKREDKKYEVKIEVKKEEKVNANKDKNTLKKELAKIEKEINEHEEKIKLINEQFELEEIYSDFMKTRELEDELENLDDELQILMRKWEEILGVLEEK